MKGSCVFDVQVVLVLTLILLGIFKIALCLRGRHVFMWQSVEILNVFNTINLKQIFWNTKTIFKKLEYLFWLKALRLKTDHFYRKLPYEKPMLRQIKWWVQNGSITMNEVLSVTTLIFWKFCFSLRTSYKELIWCTNDPNAYICTFCKHLNFIWRSKSLLQFVIMFVLPFSIFHNR